MKTIAILVLNAIFIASINSTTYYVAPSGNDTNSGLSLLLAFRTLQKAANIVIAGDNVLVSDSTYAGFDIRTSGTSVNPIIFKANGSQVIINRRNPVTIDGINIENANWIEINGFNVINQPRAGIRAVLANHITVRNNKCMNNHSWGIFTGFTDDFLAEFNECAFSVLEHGIYISNSSDRAIIRNNISHHNRAAGLHFNGDISQGGDGINHDTQVYNNIIYENGLAGGAAINMDGNQNVLVYNNIIYNNHATGIALFQIDGGGPSSGGRIFHNTIVQDVNSRWAILVVDGAINTNIKNNILINQHTFRGSINIDPASMPGFSSDYNILTNRFTTNDNTNIDSTQWKAFGFDTHSFFSPDINSLFTDFSTGDLSLKAGAKAIDFGVNGLVPSITNDIFGTSRPLGNNPDAGAVESNFTALPLHWLETSIRKTNNQIEIFGIIAEISAGTKICLTKWDDLSAKYKTVECKMIDQSHDLVSISFSQSGRVNGKNVYQLIAEEPNGQTIKSKSLTIELAGQEIHFHPNPVADYLTLDFENNAIDQIRIEDINGRLMLTSKDISSKVNLASLPPGQYILTFLNGNNRIQSKWITKD